VVRGVLIDGHVSLTTLAELAAGTWYLSVSARNKDRGPHSGGHHLALVRWTRFFVLRVDPFLFNLSLCCLRAAACVFVRAGRALARARPKFL